MQHNGSNEYQLNRKDSDSPTVLPPGTASVENPAALTSEVALLCANDVCAASKICGDLAAEGNKSTCHSEESKKAKRPKHSN
ncbi:hypothetical protein Bca4012_025657 [Brassica carinata]